MNPTITQQRAGEAAQGLVVRRREQWGARRSYTDERTVTYPASFLFFHITITNPSAYSSEDRHMQAIEGIGISRFPNTGISYNMIVMPSGRIYEGQPLGRRGAHTVNDKNLSTCITAGCPSRTTSFGSNDNLNYTARAVAIAQNVGDPVSSAQIHSIAKIGAAWKRCRNSAGIPFVARGARWHGHRCVAWKDCPGSKAWAWMAELVRLTEYYTVNGLAGEGDDWMAFIDNQTEFNAALATAMSAWWNGKMDLSGGAWSDTPEGTRLRAVPTHQMIGRMRADGTWDNVHQAFGLMLALCRSFGIGQFPGEPTPLLDLLKAANDDDVVNQALAQIEELQQLVEQLPEPVPNP